MSTAHRCSYERDGRGFAARGETRRIYVRVAVSSALSETRAWPGVLFAYSAFGDKYLLLEVMKSSVAQVGQLFRSVARVFVCKD